MTNPIPQSVQNVVNDVTQYTSDILAGNQSKFQADAAQLKGDLAAMNNDPSVPQSIKDQLNGFAPQDGESVGTYIARVSNELQTLHTEMPTIAPTSKDQ